MQRSDHAVLARLDHFRKLLRYDLSLDTLKGSPQLFENMLDSEEDIFIIGEPGKPPVISVNPQHAPLPELLRAAAAQFMSNGVEVRLQAAHLMVKEMAMLASFRQRIYIAVALVFLITAALGSAITPAACINASTAGTHRSSCNN